MAKQIQIDPEKTVGRIKPMHGVGAGPVSGNFTYDATEQFRAAGIPFGRTHDIEYPFGSGEFVDIHCIFPFFAADENDPASYNFTLTDEYLKLMREAGTEPFYRLGSTIEHQPIKRYILPRRTSASGRASARISSPIIMRAGQTGTTGTSATGRSGTSRIFRSAGRGRRRRSLNSTGQRQRSSSASILTLKSAAWP